MSQEVTLKIVNKEGEPTTTGIIGITLATEILGCCENTVRNKAASGQIRYFWVDHDQPSRKRMFYRCDVVALQKKNVKKQEMKLKLMKKENRK